MKKNQITIDSKIKKFSVFFEESFDFVEHLCNIPNSVVIVGNIVYGLYKNKIFDRFPKEKIIKIPFLEETKNLKTVLHIYNKLIKFPAKKNLTVISFGGGINQDVVGFTASTLYRGIHWIFIPTTLLAQADSCIGLKTSLNFGKYKNLIGTFYPPDEIYINTQFLLTLNKSDFYSGLGEAVKLCLMQENALDKIDDTEKELHTLVNNIDSRETERIIEKCLKIKLSYMKGDEFDQGRRNLLNYGHELGHALETASDYKVPHGIAVVLGMIFANMVSVNKGLLSPKKNREINEKILFPIIHKSIIINKSYFDTDKFISCLKKDKKRVGTGLPLVYPNENLELKMITDYNEAQFEKDLKMFLGEINI